MDKKPAAAKEYPPYRRIGPDPEWRARRPMAVSEADRIIARNLEEAKKGFTTDLSIKPIPEPVIEPKNREAALGKALKTFESLPPKQQEELRSKFTTPDGGLDRVAMIEAEKARRAAANPERVARYAEEQRIARLAMQNEEAANNARLAEIRAKNAGRPANAPGGGSYTKVGGEIEQAAQRAAQNKATSRIGSLGTALAAMGAGTMASSRGAEMMDDAWASSRGGGKGGYKPTLKKRTSYSTLEP